MCNLWDIYVLLWHSSTLVMAAPLRILLVDDEPDILELVGYNLAQEGYHIYKAANGLEALQQAQQHQPHLVLLDMMMPQLNGIEACKQLRNLPGLAQLLIVFFTARNEEFSQLKAFEAGADDYITKPIKPTILKSKIKALLRRAPAKTPKSVVSYRHIEINTANYQVRLGNDVIDLPKKEFELLALLASDPDRIFNRNEILESVWGNEVVVGERTVDVHIRKIREKIGDELVTTIKGVGYRFIIPETPAP